MWFPYSSFQQVRQPSILSPVEEDTPKIQDTKGTVFIQGPSIVLPVWRCIMFNDSDLRACMKLRIVQKLDFPFLSLCGPSHGALVWHLGRGRRSLCTGEREQTQALTTFSLSWKGNTTHSGRRVLRSGGPNHSKSCCVHRVLGRDRKSVV